MIGWLLNKFPDNYVYWIAHASTIKLVAAYIFLAILLILIINPRIFMRGKSYNKAQKIGRYCIGCGRRCRKGGRGEFCSSRCKQKQYIKEVRQNYASRRWIKKRLMANSNKCGICKQRITVQEKATIDHIVPLVKGGRDEIDNMQLAHEMCNRIKGDELPPHVIYN